MRGGTVTRKMLEKISIILLTDWVGGVKSRPEEISKRIKKRGRDH